MGKLRNKLYRFMYGRYGIDKLYYFLLGLSLLLLFSGALLRIFASGTIGGRIAYIFSEFLAISVFVIALLRVFSRNYTKRRTENQKFCNLFKKRQKLPPDTVDYIFRYCKHCGVVLRLPYKQGKHTVKCAKCGKTFNIKTK